MVDFVYQLDNFGLDGVMQGYLMYLIQGYVEQSGYFVFNVYVVIGQVVYQVVYGGVVVEIDQ